MPNVREQIVGALGSHAPSALPGDDVGIYIVSSSGKTATLTKRSALAHFQAEVGSAAARRAATVAWIKDQIAAALGSDQIDVNSVTADFDTADGTPKQFDIG